jgi:hypothetical protein
MYRKNVRIPVLNIKCLKKKCIGVALLVYGDIRKRRHVLSATSHGNVAESDGPRAPPSAPWRPSLRLIVSDNTEARGLTLLLAKMYVVFGRKEL